MNRLSFVIIALSSALSVAGRAQANELRSASEGSDKLPALIMLAVQTQYLFKFGAFEEKVTELELCDEKELANVLKEKYPQISALFDDTNVSDHYADLYREKYGRATNAQMLQAKQLTLASWSGFSLGYHTAMQKLKAQDEKIFCDTVRSSFAEAVKAASSWQNGSLK